MEVAKTILPGSHSKCHISLFGKKINSSKGVPYHLFKLYTFSLITVPKERVALNGVEGVHFLLNMVSEEATINE